ncbi:MAG TPA: hypothetical protein VNG51_19250 [Ktedonobacteraceae bacterium]|nr:hypothetical protein [Ktedonobacteraceae bacterium]
MQELSPQDNDHCYELEQDIFKIGDACVGISESNLQSPEAQAIRTNALAKLHEARELLDMMYEAELECAQNNVNEEIK